MSRYRSIARRTMESALRDVLRDADLGRVLDVGAKGRPYQESLGRCTAYLSLDIVPQAGIDIVGDIHALDWPSSDFDTVLMTEVLEHLHSPQQAVSEIHRLLRPNGVCILTTRFFHPYHPDPEDYFRFTSAGLRHLFHAFAEVDVRPLGNRAHTLWLVLSHRRRGQAFVIDKLTSMVQAVAPTGDPKWACGFLVMARKGEHSA